MFFHPDGERGHARKRRQQKAKALCAQCPVVTQCRMYSLMLPERFGTWGGLSEDERAKLLYPPRHRQRAHLGRWDDRGAT